MAGSQKELRWFAVYVTPKSEKKVAERLLRQGIEYYLPLRRSLKQWSDRKKWVEEPLVHGYVFVKIDISDRLRVLETDGVLQFVRFDRQDVVIPEWQIEGMRQFLNSGMNIEVSDELYPGEEVEISEGALQGLRGEIISYKGKKSFSIRLEYFGKTLIASVPMKTVHRVQI
ncbi:MAG TPA: UpxY family transcription antiterminator [Patescibacteria group bacterium]|nr:UpxY family transcription antiterminator [Patescibacteria group bacterium]